MQHQAFLEAMNDGTSWMHLLLFLLIAEALLLLVSIKQVKTRLLSFIG